MFRLLVRAIFRLVFRVVLCTVVTTVHINHSKYINKTKTSKKLRVVYDYIIL